MVRRSVAAVASLGPIAAVVLIPGGVLGSGGSTECSKGGGPRNGSPLGSSRTTTAPGCSGDCRIPSAGSARACGDTPPNLTHAWVDDSRRVALVFAGGKVTIMLARANYPDAPTDFRRFIAQNYAAAAIGHVYKPSCAGHQPAYRRLRDPIRPGSSSTTGESTSNIYSTSYGTQTLLLVADSLAPLPVLGVVTGIAAPCAGPPAAELRSVTDGSLASGTAYSSQPRSRNTRAVTIRTVFALAPGRYKISAPRSADKSGQMVLVRSGQTSTVNFPNY